MFLIRPRPRPRDPAPPRPLWRRAAGSSPSSTRQRFPTTSWSWRCHPSSYRLGRLARVDFELVRDSGERGGPADPTERPLLALHSPLAFDLGTLLLLAQLGCLDPVLRSFRARIGRGDAEGARRGLREFRL